MRCLVYELGLIDYAQAYKLQQELLSRRAAGEIADILLLLEHPPTITLGRSARLENVLVSPAQLAREGVSLVFTDRGGDVTYHGPGQLVGYPILDLRARGKDAHKYLRNLEEVLIRTLEDFSIASGRDENHPGVWVSDEEIAAIGLKLKRWVTMHGFALNVNTNLAHFSLINPCGFTNRRATSMAELLGREIPIPMVKERLLLHFAQVFGVKLEIGTELEGRDYEPRKTPALV
jgi:lipoate-protein ligase B